jgi:hypothetical protein
MRREGDVAREDLVTVNIDLLETLGNVESTAVFDFIGVGKGCKKKGP